MTEEQTPYDALGESYDRAAVIINERFCHPDNRPIPQAKPRTPEFAESLVWEVERIVSRAANLRTAVERLGYSLVDIEEAESSGRLTHEP